MRVFYSKSSAIYGNKTISTWILEPQIAYKKIFITVRLMYFSVVLFRTIFQIGQIVQSSRNHNSDLGT